MRLRTAVPGVLVAVAVFGAAPAVAVTTRFVVPTGGVASAPCDQAHPCTAAYVMNGAGSASGDIVDVASGTYDLDAAPIALARTLDIRGEAGSARPLFESTADKQFDVPAAAAGTKIDHVAFGGKDKPALQSEGSVSVNDVDVTSSSGCAELVGDNVSITNSTLHTSATPKDFQCLIASAPGTVTIHNLEITSSATPGFLAAGVANAGNLSVDDVRVTSPGDGLSFGANSGVMRRVIVNSGGTGIAVGGPTLTDSLVVAKGMGAVGVLASGATLRNVTAVATGSGSVGLRVPASQTSPAPSTNVVNSILRGDATDVVVDPDGNIILPCGMSFCNQPTFHGKLTLSHSNYRTKSGPIENEDASQSGDPQFTDAAGGNYRPRAGSPVIDAGVDDPANGPVDLGGAARLQGSAPDIGAYEFTPPAPPGGGGGGPPGGNPPPDVTPPVVSGLELTNSRFAVGSAPTPVFLGRPKAKRGTTFVYQLTEAGRVAIAIVRVTTGRRARSGRCVKTTHRNRKAKRCTLRKLQGTLSRAGSAGANAVPFSGRIGTRALSPGRYRATVTATDAARNKSRAKSIGFTVVRR